MGVAMDSVTDRIKRSLAQRGLWGTVRMCFGSLLARALPAVRQKEARRRQMDEDFDQQYGVDTGGTFRPKAGEVVGQNWALGNHYEAVEPDSFLDTLSKLQIHHADFTFVDFGSGKGRGLLLASEYHFRRIIGVEFCPALNRIARQNILRYKTSATRWQQIEIVEGDAGEFAIPDEPLLIFVNNSFAAPLMSKVAKNVTGSFARFPRRIVVLYFWPFFADLWEQTGFLRRIQSSPAIFDTGPIPGAVEVSRILTPFPSILNFNSSSRPALMSR